MAISISCIYMAFDIKCIYMAFVFLVMFFITALSLLNVMNVLLEILSAAVVLHLIICLSVVYVSIIQLIWTYDV